MAATGKTPILLYGSTTPTNAPTAGNLTNSSDGCEIAINVADKNLFFKDSTNTVNTVPVRQSSASSNGWLSSTDWSTFNGKAPAVTYTSTYIPYGQGTTTPAQSANFTYDGTTLIVKNGTAKVSNQLNYDSTLTVGGVFNSVGAQNQLAFNDGTYQNGLLFANAHAFGAYVNNAVGLGSNIIAGSGLGSGYQYAQTTTSSLYLQNSGTHAWYVAPSGTAGSGISFTLGQFIHNSGGVSIGDTTDPGAGNLRLGTGNLVIGTSGKGIDFSVTSQAAGMTSELLADYEEGTFTPTLSRDGTTPSLSYSVQLGTYTKIGRFVYIQAHISCTVSSQGTGNWQLYGLPYTINSTTNYRPCGSIGYSSTFAATGLYGIAASTSCYFVNAGNLVTGNAASGEIMISISYEV